MAKQSKFVKRARHLLLALALSVAAPVAAGAAAPRSAVKRATPLPKMIRKSSSGTPTRRAATQKAARPTKQKIRRTRQASSAKPPLYLRVQPWKLSVKGKANLQATRYRRSLTPAERKNTMARATRALKKADQLMLAAREKGMTVPDTLALQEQAAGHYAKWSREIRALIRARELDNKIYKEWLRRTDEARLVQLHAAVKFRYPFLNVPRATKGKSAAEVNAMLAELRGLSPAAFSKYVTEAAEGLYAGAGLEKGADLLAQNPLLLLQVEWGRAFDPTPKPSRVKMVTYKPPLNSINRWLGRSKYQVRDDLAVIWAPGVARVYTEFTSQSKALFDSGVLSLRAETGSWKNPYANAYILASKIVRAREITGNPNIRIALVGYSQGNNNVFALMGTEGREDHQSGIARGLQLLLHGEGRNARERRLFNEVRKNIVHIEDLNSAARGTPVADVGIDMLNILSGKSDKVEDLPSKLALVERFAAANGIQVKLTLGKDGQVVARYGKRGWLKAKLSSPITRTWAFGAGRRKLIGMLESLTTYRGDDMMNDPKLHTKLAGVTIRNNVGIVPESRKAELLPTRAPLDQTGGWAFMNGLNAPNDYQVPADRQKLEPALDSAVDLRTKAIGHWGITGVPVSFLGRRIHTEKNYPHFSPKLHTLGMLDSLSRLGWLKQ